MPFAWYIHFKLNHSAIDYWKMVISFFHNVDIFDSCVKFIASYSGAKFSGVQLLQGQLRFLVYFLHTYIHILPWIELKNILNTDWVSILWNCSLNIFVETRGSSLVCTCYHLLLWVRNKKMAALQSSRSWWWLLPRVFSKVLAIPLRNLYVLQQRIFWSKSIKNQLISSQVHQKFHFSSF